MRAAAALLMLAVLAALTAPLRAAPPPLPPQAHGERIVVAFANLAHSAPAPAGSSGAHYGGAGYRLAQAAQREAHRIERTYALHELSSWPIEPLAMHCVVYEITDGRPAAQVLAALSHDPGVLLAEPLAEFRTLTAADESARYNDPLYDLQTNLAALGIARAQEHAQGEGVRIALIDTAVDTAHPDLAGRIARTHSYLATPATAAASRHGTAMAGLMSAVANNHLGIVGIAPRAQLEVYEACWQLQADADAAACNTFTLAQALAAALASGAPLVNLSIAGPRDALLSALVEQGLKRGIVYVGAAGADPGGFPVGIPGVLAAGASEHPLAPGTLGAPGEHAMTLRPGAQYDFASGSSVAAAEVTGIIALLISRPGARLTPAALAQLLTPGGAGRIDVNAAFAELEARHASAAVAARTVR